MSNFQVLGAQTGDFLSKYGYGANESSDRLSVWQERVRMRPDWRDGWIMVGRLALEARHYDEALIAVNRALLLDPNYEESRKLLDMVLKEWERE